MRPVPPAKGAGFGGMFRSTMSTQTQHSEIKKADASITSTGKSDPHAQEEIQQTSAQLTNENLRQAWMSFAMKLPENERALADRMKIITPTLQDSTTFTIAVDNQLVADMFQKESARIIKGMMFEQGDTKLRMKIEVNKIVVQRHIYDRTKQYEILKEKNPIIERLRVRLNLELS